MKILKLFIISGFVSFAYSVLADDNISTQTLGEFAEPYNYNSILKMDQQENVAYLATITQENNGNKLVHLWSMQEVQSTKGTLWHQVLISDDLMKPIAPINGSPSKLSLAMHYDGVSSTQYIGWVDNNTHTISILRRTLLGNNWYVNTMPTSLQNTDTVDTIDMAVQKDGTLLVATVTHNNGHNAHLYKYITNSSGAPEPIELIDQNSKLNVPTTANYGQFKLVLVGANEVPHIVFPYSSANSKQPQAGRIAAASVNNWNQSNEPKTWSTAYISEVKGTPINIEMGSQIDAIASSNNNLIHVALIYDSSLWNAGMVTFDEESTEKWKNFQENRTNNYQINSRNPVLASDGTTVYGFYAEDHHAATVGKRAYTAAEFFNTNTYDEKDFSFHTHEVSRKDYDDEIKYTGIAMYLKDTKKDLYYNGFVSTREGDDNHNNLIIKGFTFN